jgi:CubicO group peptidase (beta-lactamase class C family)
MQQHVVGRGTELLFARAVGAYAYAGDDETSDAGRGRDGGEEGTAMHLTAMRLDTVFDVASLSKVLAATSAVAWMYQRGLLDLHARVSDILGPAFANGGKEDMTLLHCLLHNSGLKPDPEPWYWDPSFACPNTAHEQPEQDFSCLSTLIYDSVMAEVVQTPPGEVYVYSDIGFEVLSFVVGTVALSNGLVGSDQYISACHEPEYSGKEGVAKLCAYEAFVRTHVFERETTSPSLRRLQQALEAEAEAAGGGGGGSPAQSTADSPVWLPHTRFLPAEATWSQCAPTLNDTGADSYTHKRLQGQVADGDCYAMGGIAGHAGVFSTAGDVGKFLAFMLLDSEDNEAEDFLNKTTIGYFTSIYNSSQSSRALGWTTNSAEVKDFGYDNSCGTMGEAAFMHTGYTGTCMCADPSTGLWSVVLTNR